LMLPMQTRYAGVSRLMLLLVLVLVIVIVIVRVVVVVVVVVVDVVARVGIEPTTGRSTALPTYHRANVELM
jgi:hypothetical protein